MLQTGTLIAYSIKGPQPNPYPRFIFDLISLLRMEGQCPSVFIEIASGKT